jgi:hypothetical protein
MYHDKERARLKMAYEILPESVAMPLLQRTSTQFLVVGMFPNYSLCSITNRTCSNCNRDRYQNVFQTFPHFKVVSGTSFFFFSVSLNWGPV